MPTKSKCVQAAAATTNAFLISSLRYIRASAIRAAQVGAHPCADLNCLHPNFQMIHLAFAITPAAVERQQVCGRFSYPSTVSSCHAWTAILEADAVSCCPQAGLRPMPPAVATLAAELSALVSPSPDRPPLHWRRALVANAQVTAKFVLTQNGGYFDQHRDWVSCQRGMQKQQNFIRAVEVDHYMISHLFLYVTMCNSQLLLLAPPPDAEGTAQLTAHLLRLLPGELPGLRALAIGGLGALLPISAAAVQRLVRSKESSKFIPFFFFSSGGRLTERAAGTAGTGGRRAGGAAVELLRPRSDHHGKCQQSQRTWRRADESQDPVCLQFLCQK